MDRGLGKTDRGSISHRVGHKLTGQFVRGQLRVQTRLQLNTLPIGISNRPCIPTLFTGQAKSGLKHPTR